MQKLNTLHSAIYLDLEWNCPDTSCYDGAVEEIIEIGLVELDPTSLNINREASYLVRPRQLDISFRCTAITGITRCDLIQNHHSRRTTEPAKRPLVKLGPHTRTGTEHQETNRLATRPSVSTKIPVRRTCRYPNHGPSAPYRNQPGLLHLVWSR